MSKTKPRYNEIIFTNEEEQTIINMYTNGESTVKIGKKFNVSHKKIARILDEYGIKRTGVSRRKYKIQEDYFDSIDTPNKAYILGFLYADGCNFPKKQTISMSLQEEDKEILDKIRNEIHSEKSLEFIDYSKKNDYGYKYKNQYRLLMFSSHMCSSLNSIGMTPNKSLSLQFPDIDSSLYSHFIRGYFDGDGCVGFYKTSTVVTITSTNDFCVKIKDILRHKLNINSRICEASNKNGVTKVLSINGSKQVKKFLDYIYSDAELFLKRKYDKYNNKYYSKNNNIQIA